jgi:DNA-binding XRE family transcriptional regulator
MRYPFTKVNLAFTYLTVNNKITVTVIYIAEGIRAMLEAVMITPAQIRAARALIGWKQTDLATASGVSEMSIKNIERGATDPRASTLLSLQSALEGAGVVFLDPGVQREGGHGVRLR